MKVLSVTGLMAIVFLTTACQHTESALLIVDKDTVLTAHVENSPASTRAGLSATGKSPNAKLHRVLQAPSGSVLFAYDADIHRGTEAGSYGITLKPVKGSPTFAATREVTAQRDEDQIRVELVEDSLSHRKIVDVLQFVTKTDTPQIGKSLLQFHNHIFRMVHGQ